MFSFVMIFLFYSCFTLKQNGDLYHINNMKEVYENNPNNPYPNQNFVFLNKTLYELKTGELVNISSASGIVVKRKGKTLYGLTAAHWCIPINDNEFITFAMLMGYKSPEAAKNATTLTADYYGYTYNIEVLDVDNENDICMFKFKSRFANQSENIDLADGYPLLGEKVHTISSPFGIKGPTIRLHFEGYFSGCQDNSCYYTLPGTFGSSGSGILNENGELIGILTVSVVDFNTVTGGARLEDIKAIIDNNLD